MQTFPFSKKPAFFPFVSAEVFFEASEAHAIEPGKAGIDTEALDNEALDSELDKILGLADGDD